MGSLVFQANLGGSVTLVGPNTASTFSLTLPSATGSSGQFLQTDGTGVLSFASAVTAAAGSNTQVQYNSSGAFAGSANLTFNGTTLTAAGLATGGSLTLSGGTANGVAYLNGSKVVTTGSALVFDGTNLGLGVTPSAWSSSSKTFQFGANGTAAIENFNGVTNNAFQNAYRNSGGTLTYATTAAASYYSQSSGAHAWGIAPSGTAGNAISFTQAMTLDASGKLAIGTTSYTEYLTVKSPNASTFFNLQTATDSGVFVGNNGGALTLLTATTERARIDTSGNLLVGTTSGVATGVTLNPNSGAATIQVGHQNGTANGSSYMLYYYNSTQIGSITQSGTTAVLYNVTSDQRLKENIQDADSASALIDSLQVRKYDWKADGNHQRYGFIAQELVTVAPEAVHQPEDPEEMMAVDYSKLVPMLVKEIQSLRARVAQLEGN